MVNTSLRRSSCAQTIHRYAFTTLPVKIEQEINSFQGLNNRYWMSLCWNDEFITQETMISDITHYSLWLTRQFKTHLKLWVGTEQCVNPHAHIIMCSSERLREGLIKSNRDKNGKRLVRVFDGWKHSDKRKHNHITPWNPELALRGIDYTLLKHSRTGDKKMFHPNHRTCRNGKCEICSTGGKTLIHKSWRNDD